MPDFLNKIAPETRKKIVDLINRKPAGILKKNGKINAMAVAKLLSVSDRTVRRVMNEERLS